MENKIILGTSEIEIPDKNPFANCKLGREKVANEYTELLDNCSSGGTILVNSSWGTGKTTFLKMWQVHLNCSDQNNERNVIYLDAWQISRDDNILLILLGEIRKALNFKKGKDYAKLPKALLNTGLSLIGSVTKIPLNELITTIKSGTDIDPKVEEELFNISNKVKLIEEFKCELKKIGEKEKIVFLVDELDRCSPLQAIKILETIKYFFVPNIFFVIVADKNELNHIIKSYYGNDYDAHYYFKKFIDLELSLPTPNNLELTNHFIEIFRIEDLWKEFNKKESLSSNYNLWKFIVNLLSLSEYTPRHIKQVIQQFHIVYNMLIGYEKKSGKNNFLLATVCFLLIDLKYRNPKIIQKILNEVLPKDILKDIIETYKFDQKGFIEKRKLGEEFENKIAYGFGTFMYYCDSFYARDYYGPRNSNNRPKYLKNKEAADNYHRKVKSGFEFPFGQDKFEAAFEQKDIEDVKSNICYVSLQSLINRIDLIFE